MKTIHFNNPILKIIFFILIIFLCDCSSKHQTEGESTHDTRGVLEDDKSENDKSNVCFITLDLSDETQREDEDIVGYSKTESPDSILIFPNSGYYKQYRSDKEIEFHSERDVYCSDYIENPQMYVYVTNNSNESISFEKLRIDVESSALDKFPYLYIEEQYIRRYSMLILNECWTNWGTMTLEYSFDKKDKPFDGNYKYHLNVPYFNDRVIIDFKDDIINDGFNPKLIDRFVTSYNDNDNDDDDDNILPPIYGHNHNLVDVRFAMISPDNYLTQQELSEYAYPFEFGYGFDNVPYIFARVHIRISFSNSNFTKKITGIIPLTCFGAGGAEDDIKDKFDVELKPVGSNYYFDLPYVGTLRPGESERIQVGLKCIKSSHHKFILKLYDQGSSILSSKPVHFYNINGRHSSYHVLKSYE